MLRLVCGVLWVQPRLLSPFFFPETLNSGHFLTLSDCDSSFLLVITLFCLHSLQDFCVVCWNRDNEEHIPIIKTVRFVHHFSFLLASSYTLFSISMVVCLTYCTDWALIVTCSVRAAGWKALWWNISSYIKVLITPTALTVCTLKAAAAGRMPCIEIHKICGIKELHFLLETFLIWQEWAMLLILCITNSGSHCIDSWIYALHVQGCRNCST